METCSPDHRLSVILLGDCHETLDPAQSGAKSVEQAASLSVMWLHISSLYGEGEGQKAGVFMTKFKSYVKLIMILINTPTDFIMIIPLKPRG